MLIPHAQQSTESRALREGSWRKGPLVQGFEGPRVDEMTLALWVPTFLAP
jgi:hypothetical protein